jgi:hypothetical protein
MAETGLNQNVNRDYDPLTGKYIESDPVGLSGGINTYAYVGDDPIEGFDEDGLWRRIGDSSATKACGYYDDVCRRSGGKCNYYCKSAPFLCAHPFVIPSLWFGVSRSQVDCIRTCLISEDQKAQKRSSSSCANGNCLSNDVIDDYHKLCYAKCGVDVGRFPGVGPFGN